MEGAALLDLFAGSGALGLEGLSRGAARAVFVERDKEALRFLHANISRSGLSPATVLPGDVFGLWEDVVAFGPFDVVLADPPYGKGIGARLIEEAPWERLVRPRGTVVIEHEGRTLPRAPWLEPVDERRYGRTVLTFFRRPET